LNNYIEIKSEDASGYFKRAMILAISIGSNRALVDLDKALKIDPKCFEAYFIRSRILCSAGMYVEAIIDIKEALSINPKSYLAWLYYGIYNLNLCTRGEVLPVFRDEALSAIVYAHYLNPQSTHIKDLMALRNFFDGVSFKEFYAIFNRPPIKEISIDLLTQCLDKSTSIGQLFNFSIIEIETLEKLLMELTNSFTHKVLHVFNDKESPFPNEVKTLIANQYADATTLKSAYTFFSVKQVKNEEMQVENPINGLIPGYK